MHVVRRYFVNLHL